MSWGAEPRNERARRWRDEEVAGVRDMDSGREVVWMVADEVVERLGLDDAQAEGLWLMMRGEVDGRPTIVGAVNRLLELLDVTEARGDQEAKADAAARAEVLASWVRTVVADVDPGREEGLRVATWADLGLDPEEVEVEKVAYEIVHTTSGRETTGDEE